MSQKEVKIDVNQLLPYMMYREVLKSKEYKKYCRKYKIKNAKSGVSVSMFLASETLK